MKINKKTSVCVLFASLVIGGFVFHAVLADGGIMIWPPTIHVQQTDQNAIVAWNGTQELLILSTNLTKPAGSGQATLLHVVPLPNKPADIKEEDPGVFDKMVALLNDKIAAMRSQNLSLRKGSESTNGVTAAAAPSVEVVMQKTIGAHDITVVKVNVANDFSNWIDGFASGKNLAQKQISQTFKDGLQSYLKRGINYFAFDVLDLSDQSIAVKPLVYQFDTKYFYFPLLISGISEIGDSLANVNLFLVFNKDWKLPQQIWQNYGDNYSIDDSNLDIGLTLDELKGISARAASIFDGDVKVRRFSMSGKLSGINKDLMLFPRLLSSNLRIGMNNDDVKILQQLLINEGFWNSDASVSSYFGLVTKVAVMAFQQANSDWILKPLGLSEPTGFFGPYTRNYLNNNIFIDQGSGPSTLLCGNGKCDPGESDGNCPQDCGTTAICHQTNLTNNGESRCLAAGGKFTCVVPPCAPGVICNSSCTCDCSPVACGNGVCDSGETWASCPVDCGATADQGKTACVNTGGSWDWSQCGPTCAFPASRTARLSNVVTTCPQTCIGGAYVCACPADKFWASRGEGCIAYCGDGICDNGETAASCPADCGQPVMSQSGCNTDNDCASDGGTCHQCFNKTWLATERLAKAFGNCDGIGDSLCKCQGGICSVTSICGDGACDGAKGETSTNCPADCGAAVACAKEGQSAGSSGHGFGDPQCCAGLTQIVSSMGPNGTGGCDITPAGFVLCAKCGDGACESDENYCNCPQDCPNPLCGKEGEIFSGNAKRCCGNLNLKCVGPCCNDTGHAICYSTPNYTCVKTQ